MSEAKYKALFDQIEAQIADSDPDERARLCKHLQDLHQDALAKGVRVESPWARPEQDRIEDEIEAQFDNFPV